MSYEIMTIKDQERLFSKIDIRGEDECWEWQASSHNGLGYGRFRIGGRKDGKLYYPHRLMWELANKQSIPAGLEICHNCDNPKCCNPKHLFVDTHSFNLQQFHDRNPGHFQSRAGTKLTFMDAERIRELYASGEYSYREIGEMYGVKHGTIGLIMHNKIHKAPTHSPSGRADIRSRDTLDSVN